MRPEERKGLAATVAAGRDQFPVGMRVLAVDDDPVCLKVLETLLRRCQYHVTTTNQAVIALGMLRENRDMFDLVISDVHMPDMDGFKLLELVGLEMDLPVIMLSVNGETKTVMKGITHGACDYLLKPVRLEELKNIWQHVVSSEPFVGYAPALRAPPRPLPSTGEGSSSSSSARPQRRGRGDEEELQQLQRAIAESKAAADEREREEREEVEAAIAAVTLAKRAEDVEAKREEEVDDAGGVTDEELDWGFSDHDDNDMEVDVVVLSPTY